MSRLLADDSLMKAFARPSLFSTIPVTKGYSSIRYNVIIDESDSSAVYEIALPGYTKSDLEVRYSGNRLIVSSTRSDESESGYVVHMVFRKPFSLSWSVYDSSVLSATMENGILRVVMSRNVNDTSDLVPIT